MDILSMVAGAALLMLGWIFGRIARLKARPRPLPDPICQCGDQFGDHDPTTGKCQASHRIRMERRNHFEHQLVPCSCLCYVGPDPALLGLWVGGTGTNELP